MNLLRIATRKSPLALWQAKHIAKTLSSHWPKLKIELVPMTTSGDRFLKDKLFKIGGKGLFVKELEQALLENRADIAVHSMKDVPAKFPIGLVLPVICKRDSPYDALVSPNYAKLSDLPINATVGTSSLRRQSQLLAIRPDLIIKNLRGNIHTRLKKMHEDNFDAIILAEAGLNRMEMQTEIKETISSDIMLPSCGQGALGIECRGDDLKTLDLISPLNDAETALCVATEREVNALLGGSCHVPVGVFCKTIDAKSLHLSAIVASPNGSVVIKASIKGANTDWKNLAFMCVEELNAKGAKALL